MFSFGDEIQLFKFFRAYINLCKMKYVTIYDTPQQNRVTIIRHLFTEHQLDFRIFDESTNSAIPVGVRVQVREDQVERARNILRDNGFLGTPMPRPQDNENKRFWIFLLFALLAVIIVSFFINRWL